MAATLELLHPWRIIQWTDERGQIVKELSFHEGELAEVLSLPFPAGAVVREPIMMKTDFSKHCYWFRRKWCPYKPGDTFFENINQGDRLCKVLAVDEETGNYLYDYEMPRGRVSMRIMGKPVSEKALPKKWRRLRDEG